MGGPRSLTAGFLREQCVGQAGGPQEIEDCIVDEWPHEKAIDERDVAAQLADHGRQPNDKRELERACARAGVPRVTPNDLRRTFATWLKQKDVDSAVVAVMMGHSSTAMVDRVYGKLDEMSFQRAIASAPAGRDHAGGGGSGLSRRCHVRGDRTWRGWHA